MMKLLRVGLFVAACGQAAASHEDEATPRSSSRSPLFGSFPKKTRFTTPEEMERFGGGVVDDDVSDSDRRRASTWSDPIDNDLLLSYVSCGRPIRALLMHSYGFAFCRVAHTIMVCVHDSTTITVRCTSESVPWNSTQALFHGRCLSRGLACVSRPAFSHSP